MDILLGDNNIISKYCNFLQELLLKIKIISKLQYFTSVCNTKVSQD